MRSGKPPAKSRSAARSEAWRARPLPAGLAGTLRRLREARDWTQTDLAKRAGLAGTLRRLREARDWTQADLAKRAGLAFSSIQALESGRTKSPTLDTLRSLAEALGVTVGALTV